MWKQIWTPLEKYDIRFLSITKSILISRTAVLFEVIDTVDFGRVCAAVLAVFNVDAITTLAIFGVWFVAAKFILVYSSLFCFIENNDWFNRHVQALFIFLGIVYRAMKNINTIKVHVYFSPCQKQVYESLTPSRFVYNCRSFAASPNNFGWIEDAVDFVCNLKETSLVSSVLLWGIGQLPLSSFLGWFLYF